MHILTDRFESIPMIRYEICQLFIIHWEHNSVTGVVPVGAVEIAAHIVQLAGSGKTIVIKDVVPGISYVHYFML